MLDEGLVAEVQALLAEGLPADCPGLQSPGYREIVAHLQGSLDLPEALRLIQRAHRRYARRQRTWFRKTRGILWYPSAGDLPMAFLEEILGEATPRPGSGSIDSPPPLC